MHNALRGEIAAELDGQKRVLCLTLGALAELETAFGAGDLLSLAARFQNGRLSARDIIIIIACGLRGGGAPVSEADVASMRNPEGLSGFVKIAADLVAATFGGGDGAPVDSVRPPAPQDV